MNKFAIALLVSAGTLISVQAHASDRAVIGAVDGALVGSYFGGAHGAVAGAIIGAAVGSSSDGYYDRRGWVRGDREYVRYEPSPIYYASQSSYEPYYESSYDVRYEPRRVVYVQSPVYDSYPLAYASYRGPAYGYGYGYSGRYAPSHRSYYAPTRNYPDHHRRY